ncbi:TPA: hypothetical protein HA317_02085 [Candidatus Woesearchaeota archaeon]|nr:hypothetical protein [Candidatus Woesearchaeota archaeon]
MNVSRVMLTYVVYSVITVMLSLAASAGYTCELKGQVCHCVCLPRPPDYCSGPIPLWQCYNSEPPGVDIISPVEGAIYSTSRVPLEVQSNKSAAYIKRSIDGGRPATICTSCSSISTTMYVSDQGRHRLTAYAYDKQGNEGIAETYFIVDTRAPRILGQSPADKSTIGSDQEFAVDYDEANLANVSLCIKGELASGFACSILTGCESGSRESCSVNKDLSSYADGTLEYYFEVSDLAGQTTRSGTYSVALNQAAGLPIEVMITSPEEGVYDTSRLRLIVNLSRPAKYIKRSLASTGGNGAIIVCSNCKDADKLLFVPQGSHKLTVYAYDEDGTAYSETLSIAVDSRRPMIRMTLPRAYPGRPTYAQEAVDFGVVFMESDPRAVMLHLEQPDGSFSEISLDNCSGRSYSQTCTKRLGLSGYADKQEIGYYFSVSDPVSTTYSKNGTLIYDVQPPNIAIASPIEGMVYNSRLVYLNVSLNEQASSIKTIVDGSRYRRTLCSRCTGRDSRLYFRDGMHNVTVIATDDAGNTAEKTVVFAVDTGAW